MFLLPVSFVYNIDNNFTSYNSISTLRFRRKEFGLDKFVPVSLMESMKRKELRKLLTHLLKLNQTITGTAHKTLTSLQAKLYYLTIIAELPSYGAKCFPTGIRVSKAITVSANVHHIFILSRINVILQCTIVGRRAFVSNHESQSRYCSVHAPKFFTFQNLFVL